MDESLDLYDYAADVRQVLLQPNLMLGIGVMPCMAIMIVTAVLMNMVSPVCIFFGIVVFIIAKIVCKKDFYTLEFLFDKLMEPEVWRC